MKQSEILQKLNGFLSAVGNGDVKEVIEKMQAMMDYQAEKIRIYEDKLCELTGRERPELNDDDRKRLAHHGHKLNDYLLSITEITWCPDTVRGWHRDLVGKKYDSTGAGQKRRGRKPISPEIVEKVLYFNKRNPDWGYDHIAGTMQYLGYNVSASTIRKVLNDHGIIPDPELRKRGDWNRFINAQQHVTAATDFATVERVTPFGLVREHILLFMDIGKRELKFGGICHSPDGNWTKQVARNMCDMWDGWLLGKKYLIHDRDSLFSKDFDMIISSIGIEPKKLPPFCPMMNSRMENAIRALKTECLDKLVFSTQEQIHYAVTEFIEYYNHYRPSAGLDGKMVMPYPQDPNGEIVEVTFLGVLLHGYRRERVAA